MFDKYRNFIKGVSVNWYGRLGVILVTSSFITFVIFELARISGLLVNAYIGLITYLLFPSLFVFGLFLIPVGWHRLKNSTGQTSSELLRQQFNPEDNQPRLLGSRVIQTIAILTMVNVLFLIGAGSQMLHFMDEPRFCGTACHSVMNPEWTTYQASPHSHVKCVDCHVGEGVDALVDSKLNGAWQMISLAFKLYEKPIPTPVHQLRPARETCEKCHWPEKFYGRKLKNIVNYALDSSSTPHYTTLSLKIDSGKLPGQAGIHWHVGSANEVKYASVDDNREEIIWVEVKYPDGSTRRYNNKDISSSDSTKSVRVMDCVDCHNRATHIYEYPDDAIRRRIQTGMLNRNLPFLAREALAAISPEYPTQTAAATGIANHLNWFYKHNYAGFTQAHQDEIDSEINVLIGIYSRNIHPDMNIYWGSYVNHIGHKNSPGCFRCHAPNLIDENGRSIPYDCTLCHSLLAYDSPEPFSFLMPVDTSNREFEMHKYLQSEFLKSYPE